MDKELNRKVGEMEYDKLISAITPRVKVASGVVAVLGAETSYKRGTVMAKGDDGKLYILGSTGGTNPIPDCILCDNETIGATADTNVAVYVAGCFNPKATTVETGYTMTMADRDKLKERGLYFAEIFD